MYVRKILLLSLVVSLITGTVAPTPSHASSPSLSKDNLTQYLEHNPGQDAVKSYTPAAGDPGRGSLQDRTMVQYTESSNRSPIIYGAIPSWCNDISVIIFPDTANIDTGEGLYIYRGNLGDDTSYESTRVWQLNLQTAGLSLINGKYNVYVAACLDQGGGGDPLYSDLFHDKVFIYPAVCDASCTPVHRFYNKQNGSHFYTSVEHEKRQVMERKDIYGYEGIASFARTNQQVGTIAVHRFYNMSAGTHFYTANQAEATNVNNNMSSTYKYEGVSYYAYTSQEGSTQPVHRFYKFKQGVHFYTANQAEATNVNNNMGHTYRYEGISYYNIENN